LLSLNRIESIIGNLNEITYLFLRITKVTNKTRAIPNTDPIIIPNIFPKLLFSCGFISFFLVVVVVEDKITGRSVILLVIGLVFKVVED
jgi:hypothetical protein